VLDLTFENIERGIKSQRKVVGHVHRPQHPQVVQQTNTAHSLGLELVKERGSQVLDTKQESYVPYQDIDGEQAIRESAQEAEHLRRMLAGDHRAFQWMYREYSPLVFRRLLRLLGDFQQAEECLQQVFVEVVDKMHTYRSEGSWQGWLNKITTNTVLQTFRKQKRHRSFLANFSPFWKQKKSFRESEAIPESFFAQEERKQWVHDALRKLDARKRIVILLCDLEGKKLDDVALELNLPKGTVASRLHNGRNQLRNIISSELKRRGTSVEEWIHD